MGRRSGAGPRLARLGGVSRIAILGASCKLGDRLAARALELGFRVNAMSRTPEKIKRHAEAVNVYRGDAASGVGLEAALASCKNVVFAIASELPVIAQCAANVVRQLQNNTMLARLVFISCARHDEDKAHPPKKEGLLSRLMHPAQRKVHWDDLTEAAGIVSLSGLSYVILRTTPLVDEPSKHPVVAAPHHPAPPGKVSRHDLAHYVLDLVNQPTWAAGELVVGTRPP